MPLTQVKGHQIHDGTIKRDDLNTDEAGQAVTRKIVAGTGVSLSSTGTDAGTGDVTINCSSVDSITKQGIESISNAASTVVVTFGEAFDDTTYSIEATIVNTTDGTPSQYSYLVTSKATTGFTLTLSGATDSANYDLEWLATKANVGASSSAALPLGYATFRSGCIQYKDADEIYIPANNMEINEKTANWDSQLTKQLTSLSSNTWYYIYLDESEISDGTDVTASEIIYSTTAPTKSDSLKYWANGNDRCIGCILTDGSSNIKSFSWNELSGYYQWGSKIVELNNGDSPGTFTDLSLTASCPNLGEMKVVGRVIIASPSTSGNAYGYIYLRKNGGTDEIKIGITAYISSARASTDSVAFAITDTTQKLEYMTNVSGCQASWYSYGFYMTI